MQQKNYFCPQDSPSVSPPPSVVTGFCGSLFWNKGIAACKIVIMKVIFTSGAIVPPKTGFLDTECRWCIGIPRFIQKGEQVYSSVSVVESVGPVFQLITGCTRGTTKSVRKDKTKQYRAWVTVVILSQSPSAYWGMAPTGWVCLMFDLLVSGGIIALIMFFFVLRQRALTKPEWTDTASAFFSIYSQGE